MSDSIAEHLTSQPSSGASASEGSTFEPVWALVVGGLAGAVCFFLFALLFGARWALAVAAASAIVAFLRCARIAGIAFIAAAALAAIGAAPSTSFLFIGSLAFGAGLAVAARDYARAHASGFTA